MVHRKSDVVSQRDPAGMSFLIATSMSAPANTLQPDGNWVLYYTNPPHWAPAHHCIGAALATHVPGPYVPTSSEPFICDLSQGGAIDPAAFRDEDGSYWLVYKVDGNSLGSGGACKNGIPPIKKTPIMLQRLGDDLVSLVGKPVQLITNDHPEDGPDVEAPSLVKKNGVYYLFYSSNCFTSPEYDVAYATATSIKGPYTRKGALLKTGDLGLVAPGGAGVDLDAEHVVFHANCPQGRCMYTGMLTLNGKEASI
jgi:beta-xylosidase